MEITLTLGAEENRLGICEQPYTCITGPTTGNLCWNVSFGNGSEVKFARNDGGNIEDNPAYQEISFDAVTKNFTFVTRSTIDNIPAHSFNSTLYFDVIKLIQSNVTSISCATSILCETATNTRKISPQIPQFNGKFILNISVRFNLFLMFSIEYFLYTLHCSIN